MMDVVVMQIFFGVSRVTHSFCPPDKVQKRHSGAAAGSQAELVNIASESAPIIVMIL